MNFEYKPPCAFPSPKALLPVARLRTLDTLTEPRVHPKNLPHFHQHFSNDTRELPRVMSTPNVIRKRKGLTTPVSPKVVDGEERVRCLFGGLTRNRRHTEKRVVGGLNWTKNDNGNSFLPVLPLLPSLVASGKYGTQPKSCTLFVSEI